MFCLRWLFFALFHVKSQGTAQVSESLESAGRVGRGLDAAIIIHEVDYWCSGQDSGKGCEHVAKPVVGPYTGSAPKKEDMM